MSDQDDLDSKIREAQKLEPMPNVSTSSTEEFLASKTAEKDREHLSIQSIGLRINAAKAQKKEDENKLRSRLCNWTIGIIAFQLVACDAFVICYVCFTIFYLRQSISDILISTWIGSNFVEIIGILWVIARSLFPFHDSKRDKKAEKR